MTRLNSTVTNPNPMAFVCDYGVSETAEEIQKEAAELKDHFYRSVTFGERFFGILEGLFLARSEYSLDNWDGYGAKAIDDESFGNAIRLALSLPPSIPLPETYVDPDGELIFEWYEGKRRVFSLNIGRRNRLSYAGLYGFNKTYGEEYFYDYLPEVIKHNISRLYSE